MTESLKYYDLYLLQNGHATLSMYIHLGPFVICFYFFYIYSHSVLIVPTLSNYPVLINVSLSFRNFKSCTHPVSPTRYLYNTTEANKNNLNCFTCLKLTYQAMIHQHDIGLLVIIMSLSITTGRRRTRMKYFLP